MIECVRFFGGWPAPEFRMDDQATLTRVLGLLDEVHTTVVSPLQAPISEVVANDEHVSALRSAWSG